MATSSVALDALIGVGALTLVELAALALEARRSHPPGVPVRSLTLNESFDG